MAGFGVPSKSLLSLSLSAGTLLLRAAPFAELVVVDVGVVAIAGAGVVAGLGVAGEAPSFDLKHRKLFS